MRGHNAEAPVQSGFDKLARAYRWMEYLSFGPLLQRCRAEFLPRITGARRALVLGDGDGRFCVALLQANLAVSVVAVDESAAMLRCLYRRAKCAGVAARLTVLQADATAELPMGEVDLVCTHFFLDCLSDRQVHALAAQIRRLCPHGLWLLSEFAVPAGAARWPARLVVFSLYRAFGLLTGLRTRTLPDHSAALQANGFVLLEVRTKLFGLLRSELWAPKKHDRDSTPRIQMG